MSGDLGENKYRADLFAERFDLDTEKLARIVAEKVVLYCRRYQVPLCEADDITQNIVLNVFLKYCTSDRPPRAPDNPEAFLKAIARRRVIDFIRKAARGRDKLNKLGLKLGIETFAEDETSAEDETADKVRVMVLVDAAIDRLPEAYQRVILRFWNPIDLTFRAKPIDDEHLSGLEAYPEPERYTYLEMAEILWGPLAPGDRNRRIQMVGRACRAFEQALRDVLRDGDR